MVTLTSHLRVDWAPEIWGLACSKIYPAKAKIGGTLSLPFHLACRLVGQKLILVVNRVRDGETLMPSFISYLFSLVAQKRLGNH
jgi:hypothetical protein